VPVSLAIIHCVSRKVSTHKRNKCHAHLISKYFFHKQVCECEQASVALQVDGTCTIHKSMFSEACSIFSFIFVLCQFLHVAGKFLLICLSVLCCSHFPHTQLDKVSMQFGAAVR